MTITHPTTPGPPMTTTTRTRIDLTPDQAHLLHAYQQLIQQRNNYQQAADHIRQQLETILGDAEEANINGQPAIRYAWTKPRETLDIKALRHDHPDIAIQYTRTSPPTRPFRIITDQ